MNKIVSILTVIISFSIIAQVTFARDFIPNQVIIKYKSGIYATKSMAVDGRRYIKSDTMPQYVTDNMFLINTVDNVSNTIDDILETADTGIEYVQPNYIYYSSRIPNDPYYEIKTTGESPKYPYWFSKKNGINAEEAWDTIQDSNDLIIGVLDTGIDIHHEDLMLNIATGGGIDTFTNTSGADQGIDEHGHGTHVAGIIGAVGNNQIGTVGVLWRTKLMPLKVLNKDGEGTTASVVAGIDFAIKNNVKVINASLGGSANVFDAMEYEKVKEAVSKGIVFVAAAGNDNKNTDINPEYPAAGGLPGLISVGASNELSKKALFKNGNASCYGKTTVHIFAPGQEITSTYAGTDTNGGKIRYGASSGTSMATPFVTGAVAMLLTKHPNLTPTQVEMVLLNSARKAVSIDPLSMSGGILDLKAMLDFDINKLYTPPSELSVVNAEGSDTIIDLSWKPAGKGNIEIWTKDDRYDNFTLYKILNRGETSYRDILPATMSGKRYYRLRSVAEVGSNQNTEKIYSAFVRKQITYNNKGIPNDEAVLIGQARYAKTVTNNPIGGCSISHSTDSLMILFLSTIILRVIWICRKRII